MQPYLIWLAIAYLINRTVCAQNDLQYLHRKCCKNDEHLVLNGTYYHCDKNNIYLHNLYIPMSRRINATTSNTECVDVSLKHRNVDLLVVKNHQLVKQLPVAEEDKFPKCCPVGRVYDREQHRCVDKQESAAFDGVLEAAKRTEPVVVSVGFLHCNNSVIADQAFGRYEELESALKGLERGQFCVDDALDARYVLRRCRRPDYCDGAGVVCLKKCCPDGYSYFHALKCSLYPHFHSGFDYRNLTEFRFRNVAFINGVSCKRSPAKYVKINEDGSFTMTSNSTNVSPEFCIEHVDVKNYPVGYKVFACSMQPRRWPAKEYIVKVGLIISSICLLITIVVYCILYDTHNCYSKCLILYCVWLLITFLVLVTLKFNSRVTSNGACQAIAFLIQFSAISTISWLTILCVDMWCTFGIVRSMSMDQRGRERRKFIKYNLFAWTVPLIWLTFTIIVHSYKFLPSHYVPVIGNGQCMIQKINYGYYIFHLMPIGILTLINIVLFVKTTYYCLKVKEEINRMKDIKQKKCLLMDKERLMLLMKLIMVMGVPFTFEVISSAVDFDQNLTLMIIATFFDTVNSLQGLFILLIFMLKRKIKVEIYKKLGMKPLRHISYTASTASTQLNATTHDATASRNVK